MRLKFHHEDELNQVERVAKKGNPMFVMFVEEVNKAMTGEKAIIKVTDQFDIGLVKVIFHL